MACFMGCFRTITGMPVIGCEGGPAHVKSASKNVPAGFGFDVRLPLESKRGPLVEKSYDGKSCKFRDVFFSLEWPRLDIHGPEEGEPWGQDLIQNCVVHPRPSLDGSIADGSIGFALQFVSRDGADVSTFFARTNAERQEWCDLLRKHSVHHNLENGFKATKKVLGTGAYATVYLGQDKITQEFVALKVIDRLRLNEEERKVLAQEAWISQDIKHRYCVRTREFIETKSSYVLVMEHVAGGDLFERLQYNRYHESEVRSMMRQLIDGVAFLHARNIAHFDLKPENILLTLDRPMSIKIADFGVSLDLKSKTPCNLRACLKTSGLVRCSPGYGAPEVVNMQVTFSPPVGCSCLDCCR